MARHRKDGEPDTPSASWPGPLVETIREPAHRAPDPEPLQPPPSVRLEYLRGEIRAERISYSELAELQGMVEHIDPGDVELLEWAGVPEHADDTDLMDSVVEHP